MEFRVWLDLVALGAPRIYSVLYRHYLLSDASPKAISGRTSYLPTRLEFLPYPQVIRGRFSEFYLTFNLLMDRSSGFGSILSY